MIPLAKTIFARRYLTISKFLKCLFLKTCNKRIERLIGCRNIEIRIFTTELT
jgi:hypothetical protein